MKRTLVIILGLALSLGFVMQVNAIGVLQIDKSLSIAESPISPNNSQDFILTLSPTPIATTTISFTTDSQCAVANENDSPSTGGAIVSDNDSFNMRVVGVDDAIGEGNHICTVNFITSSTDSNYDGATLNVDVAVADDGDVTFQPKYSVVQTAFASLEEGSSAVAKYRITMNRAALDPVTITATGGTNCQMLTGSPQVRADLAELTIASGQQQTREFSVIARQDEVFEGFHSCIISHKAVTIDQTFLGVTVPPLILSVKDDDLSDLQQQNKQQAEDELNQEIVGRGQLDLYDANNDGIVDSQQSNVQSFVNVVSGTRHAFEVEGCDIRGSILSLSERGVVEDQSLHFPYGLADFSLSCDQLGQTATVNWILDQSYPLTYPWILRKVDNFGQVEAISDAIYTTKELQNGVVTVVSYDITDGGSRDADGEKNGVIVDPIGLALPLALIDGLADDADAIQQSFWSATKLSVLAILTIFIIIWIVTRPPIGTRLNRLISGKPSKKPRIDKY